MLSENLKTLRKQKGLSQEMLAMKLDVVRQTISKWEKGVSVPDAEMLIRLSEIYEVPISKLLGKNIEDEKNEDCIAEHLAQISEQLVIKNKRTSRILKAIVGIVVAVFIIRILMIVLSFTIYRTYTTTTTTPEISSGVEEIIQ